MRLLTVLSKASALPFAALLLLSACGQDPPEKLMASARDHVAKGDRSAAVIELRNVLKAQPENGEARLMLGLLLLEADDFASAEKEFARALELRQPVERALPGYVDALLAQGKFQAVIDEVEKRQLFSADAVAATQSARGEAYARLGRKDLAQEAYAAASAAVPGYPRARLGLAALTAAEGRIDESLAEMEQIIAADPKMAQARTARAELLLAKGDRDGAKKALQETIEADPRYLPARLSLIGLLIDERSFDDAAKLIEGTRKVAGGDIRLAYLEASLAFRQRDLEKSRQLVQQVLKRRPEHVASLVLAGTIDLLDKQYAAAEASLRRALVRAPGSVDARRFLVQTYLAMGQPAKALDTLKPFVERGIPADPRLRLLAGETYLANGDMARATEYFGAAKAEKGQEVAALTRLGQIALATGRSDEGFRDLEAASDLDAGAYQADLAIIVGHLGRREYDKALAAVQALEKKQPNNPLTYQMYGAVHIAKKDLAAARRSFERALQLQPSYLPAAQSLALLDRQAGKPDDARKRYEAMIAKDEKNDQLYLALAELQMRTGAEAKVIGETLQRAVGANPQSVAARLALINFHLRSGDMKAAATAAQSAVAAMPGDPRILDVAGVAYEAAGDVNQAIETFSKLAALQPQSLRPLYRLAGLHLQRNELDKAVAVLRRAQKIAPDEREVVAQLVRVHIAIGRYDAALNDARDLQKRQPKSAAGFALEGDVLLAQRDHAAAERLYRQALKLEATANAVAIKLHGTLVAQGKKGEAEALARKWLADNPKDAAMRVYLGESDIAAGNLKSAAVHFRAAVALEPRNVLALNNLAWVSGELGDPKALGYAAQAVKLAPNSADVLDTYGMLLVKKGEAAKALPVLERARKLEPARSDLRLNYARALAKAGRKDEARKELEALAVVKENFRGKDEVAGLLKGL